MLHPDTEIVTLTREVVAVLVPSGERVSIPEATEAGITQALGGSFTLFIEGRLFRVDGKDADALGKTPPSEIELPDDADDDMIEQLAWNQMRTCYDPEIPINIVELGLIYSLEVTPQDDGQRQVRVEMTLTAPGCGMGDILVDDVRSKIERIPTISEVQVDMVFDPPWNQTMMSEAARLQTGML